MCEHVKKNVKNEQRAKLAKRAELPRIKLEYAPNWHRVEVGRAKLVRVQLARVKKDAPNWNDSSQRTVWPVESRLVVKQNAIE